MQRRTYTILSIFLALVRLWFALSPSYLHPDENFQGPEVIAGQIFSYPVRRTWEFDSERPIRSVFPLWPVYGLPMLLLRWIWAENGRAGHVAPELVFWTLRVLMFALSFVLEDWALHELIHSPRQRRVALLLVASSYVTWTYQTHTFSNSVETLVVAWSLVLIQRLVESRTGPAAGTSALLGVVAAFGFFNRITFPAFLLVPAVRLMPHLYHRPLALFSLVAAGLATAILAIVLDTEFYTPAQQLTWTSLLTNPVITPLNNILYNMDVDNLARHGLHPPYQHVVANLPLLIGPAMPLLLLGRPHLSDRLYSAISGVAVLSAFRHQEARFLLPAVPLILSSVRLPRRPAALRVWVGVWVAFNAVLGVLMGVYHQGGVVPGQVFISGRADATTAVWWKTYTPPIWLLDGKNEVLTTRDVMGMRGEHLLSELAGLATCDSGDNGGGDGRSDHSGLAEQKNGTYLIAPASADWLDPHLVRSGAAGLRFGEVWRYRRHLNLDDLDFASDGVWNTLVRVVGRRGLVAWRVTKSCGTDSRGELAGDPAAGTAARAGLDNI